MTVLSAIVPARRAVRIPPVAALVEHSEDQPRSLRRRRVIAGGAVAVAGVVVGAGRAGRAGGRAGRARRAGRVHRRRHARAGPRAAAVERARPPARRAARDPRAARARELDAQPAPDRADRRRADDRPGARVDDRRARRLAQHVGGQNSVDSAVSADYIVGGIGGFSKSVVAGRLPAAGRRRRRRPSTRGSSSSAARCRASPPRPPAGLSQTVNLHITAGSGAPALAAGELLVDTNDGRARDDLHVGSVVPVKFAQTGVDDDAGRRDLRAQPAGRQLHRRRRLLPLPLRQPAPGRRPAQHRPRRAAISSGAEPRARCHTRTSAPRPARSSRVAAEPASTSCSGSSTSCSRWRS